MSATAIFRVTEALRARLKLALDEAIDPGEVFVGPLDDPDAKGAPLILFLYRVVPNASLRNREHRVPKENAPETVEVYRNALPLDLYYLVTVGTLPGLSEENRLKTLGYAMRALNAAPQLVGAAVGHETVNVSLEPMSTEEISRIWALFPTVNYRTTIAYLASPVWIDPPAPPVDARPVLQDRLRSGQRATRSEERI